MKKKDKLYLEAITAHTAHGFSIRVWRKAIFGFEPSLNQIQVFKHISKFTSTKRGRIIENLAKHVCKLSGVNAVEIKGKDALFNTRGIVVYKNWP